MTAFGKELIESANEALAIAKGEAEPARVVEVPQVDVKAVRQSLGLSQARFSTRFRIPVGTVRDWEQSRRSPDKTAQILLAVIATDPDAVDKALSETGEAQAAAG